jgi:hypothetical protein
LANRIVQDNNPRKTKFTFEEAVDVWLRHWAGQFQHEIAAAYVINSGRVSDVLNEVTHVGSKEEERDESDARHRINKHVGDACRRRQPPQLLAVRQRDGA